MKILFVSVPPNAIAVAPPGANCEGFTQAARPKPPKRHRMFDCIHVVYRSSVSSSVQRYRIWLITSLSNRVGPAEQPALRRERLSSISWSASDARWFRCPQCNGARLLRRRAPAASPGRRMQLVALRRLRTHQVADEIVPAPPHHVGLVAKTVAAVGQHDQVEILVRLD
jgi:hypothetical protein